MLFWLHFIFAGNGVSCKKVGWYPINGWHPAKTIFAQIILLSPV